MPLHDLKCPDGHEFEARISGKTAKCPACGKVSKIIWKQFPGIFADGDICDPFKSQVDGKFYSSKKQYRRSLKDHGMLEVGEEKVKPKPFEPISLKKELHEELKKIEERNG